MVRAIGFWALFGRVVAFWAAGEVHPALRSLAALFCDEPSAGDQRSGRAGIFQSA